MPKWNETINIDVKYVGDDLSIEVLDKDVTSSDLIGSVTMKLSGLCMNGGMDEWYDIQYKGKKAGAIHLKGDWTPTTATAPAHNNNVQQATQMFGAMMAGQPAPQYQPQPQVVYVQQQPYP